jgi:hypothetical protein
LNDLFLISVVHCTVRRTVPRRRHEAHKRAHFSGILLCTGHQKKSERGEPEKQRKHEGVSLDAVGAMVASEFSGGA